MFSRLAFVSKAAALWKGSSRSDTGQILPDGYQVPPLGSDSLLYLIKACSEFLTALEKPTQAPERAENGNFCQWHGREERPLPDEDVQGQPWSRGAEQFGSESPLVLIIGVSITGLMALWFLIQGARLFTASAESLLLLLLLTNHCLRLVFRNAAGFQPFLTHRRSRTDPCPMCCSLAAQTAQPDST